MSSRSPLCCWCSSSCSWPTVLVKFRSTSKTHDPLSVLIFSSMLLPPYQQQQAARFIRCWLLGIASRYTIQFFEMPSHSYHLCMQYMHKRVVALLVTMTWLETSTIQRCTKRYIGRQYCWFTNNVAAHPTRLSLVRTLVMLRHFMNEKNLACFGLFKEESFHHLHRLVAYLQAACNVCFEDESFPPSVAHLLAARTAQQ